MYSTCLFCASSLGTNEAIEAFPVGSRVAFDASRGRLWAVCPRCGRWNLAPIEERWEAVEEADRLFTDTRMRAQSENIGLARLRDGTRLVRVGKALQGELAAWRYGGHLVSRRRRNVAAFGGGAAVVGALIVGAPVMASLGIPFIIANIGLQVAAASHIVRQQKRVVHRLPALESPTGRDLIIRRWHVYDSVLTQSANGELAVQLPAITRIPEDEGLSFSEHIALGNDPVLLTGDAARRVVARSMIDYNYRGAKPEEVNDALNAIAAAGGPDAFTNATAASGAAIVRKTTETQPNAPLKLRHIIGTFRGEVMPVRRMRSIIDDRPRLSRPDALALEIALQEEAERRALEGELAALEAAWREAEEIARIADALPDEPPDSQQQE
jgi:hypothetical protein